MPKTCNRCESEYEDYDWDFEYSAYYDHTEEDICPDCESELWEDEEEGMFIGHCAQCGREIDIFEEYHAFCDMTDDGYINNYEIDESDYCGYCRDCAYSKAEEDIRELDDEYNEMFDNNDSDEDEQSDD